LREDGAVRVVNQGYSDEVLRKFAERAAELGFDTDALIVVEHY
jgi:lipocalin